MTLAKLREWLLPSSARRDADPRWVVVDTETSGLDPATDTLLAIGAVAVDGGGIRLDDSFEVVLQVDAPSSRDNVVIHGIGHEAQRTGMPAQAALRAFVDFVADAPCAGFHCEFDVAVLARAAAEAGVALPPPRWLDLAPLAGALVPEGHRRGRRSLDDWLTAFAIDVTARHSAAGDALATAELLLRLRALAAAQRVAGFAGLLRLSRQGRWLSA